MENKDRPVIEKILHHVQTTLLYCEHVRSLEEFQNNSMLVDACVFNLMQIGELAKQSLSDTIRSDLPELKVELETALLNP